jgi:hypothetical protein
VNYVTVVDEHHIASSPLRNKGRTLVEIRWDL